MSEQYIVNQDILARVLEMSRQMAETRELNPLLQYVMDQSISLTNGQHGYLVLLTDDDSLDFRVVHGQPDIGTEQQGPVSKTIIEQVIRDRGPVLIKNALQDLDFNQALSVKALQLRSVICVPLISQREVLGVLYLENRHAINAFSEDDIPKLVIFASQAAGAIQNAKLNETLRQAAAELERRVDERTAELEDARYETEQSWHAALEANHQRTVLLGNIAHDIRSPLNTVVSALTMMRDGFFGDTNEDQNLWIERSLTAIQQVLVLATDVFDLTKIEQGRLSFTPTNIDLRPILHQALAIAEGLKRMDSEIELDLDVPMDLPQIFADGDRVRQILINLLSNSIKFTPKGAVTIRGGLTDNGNYIMLGVEDTGSGIPAADIPFIFERFRQAANQEKAGGYKGTGLGLAICKQLVEQHGGEIWVESTVGHGTTFFFTLPVMQ